MTAATRQVNSLWLSDGWAAVNTSIRLACARSTGAKTTKCEFTLGRAATISTRTRRSRHVSLYEADAYARWVRRAAADRIRVGTSQRRDEARRREPARVRDCPTNPVPDPHVSSIGDVWEWTSSPYMPYPGFKPLAGSLGEYNGKFMSNQMTVRGGSCVTSADHVTRKRIGVSSTRIMRWQFLGHSPGERRS